MLLTRNLVLSAALLAVPATAQAFLVTAVSPALNANAVSPAAHIVLTLSEAVQSSTVTKKAVQVFGRWSCVVPGSLSVAAGGKQVVFRPSRPYFPAETVTVSVASTLQSTTKKPLTGGFFASFFVASSPATRKFTLTKTIKVRNTNEKQIATYGVYAGDINRDGRPDITAINEFANDIRLMLNDGCGSFGPKATTSAPKQKMSPSEGADFNGDGWPDVAIGGTTSAGVSVFLGDGKGGYQAPTIYSTGGFTHGITVLDANADGHADIATVNHSRLLIFLNDGKGKFGTPKSFDTGGVSEDNVAAVDANGDGLVDLFVGNYTSETVTCMLGDGTGSFKLSGTQNCGGRPFSLAVGDIDGDGNVDAVTANWRTDTMGVVRGNGKGGFFKVVTHSSVGKMPTAVDLGDIDGDGHLDCSVSSYGSAKFTVFWNNKKGSYTTSLTLPSSKAGSCTTLVDFDRDGDCDIIAADEIADELRLLTHDDAAATGTQRGACKARLRVNNLAGSAGFGSAALQLTLGQNAFLGVSGQPNKPLVVGFGGAKSPGVTTPFGLFNLDPLLFTIIGQTNSIGDYALTIAIPTSVTPGVRATLQALVDPNVLTNPETVVLVR